MNNDCKLASSIGRGDRRADEEFVDRFGARVQRLVKSYVAVNADAEDLTQEIFVELFRSAATFRGEAAFSTWVYRVSLNHCLRYRARAKPPGEPLDERHEIADDEPDPARQSLRSELQGQVHGAVERLSPVQRDVVILHELHGLTYSECAAALDIPVGTVKSRLSNAFKALRSSLSTYVLDDTDINESADRRSPIAGGEAI